MEYINRIKGYAGFSSNELKWISVSIVVMGFIVGFNDSRETFQMNLWIANLLMCLIIVSISVFFKEIVKRLYGLVDSLRTEYRHWHYGLIAGIILAVISNGAITFLAAGGIILHMLRTHRLGKYRYGLSYNMLGMTSMMGPLASMLLAVIAKMLVFLPEPIIHKIIVINVALALSNMLPIPPLDGANVFFAIREAYFFILGAIIGLAVLLLHPAISLMMSLIGAVIIGFFVLTIYFIFIDKRLL